MKIYDFDSKFFDYVRVQLSMQPALKEEEIEEKYNQMMESWLNAPAQWLNGTKPIDYFKRYEDPKDLLKLFEEYMKRDIGLPELLYTRIVEVGEPCAPQLTKIAEDMDRRENLRATAMALLKDIGSELPVKLYIDLVCRSRESNELGEIACDSLKALDVDITDELLKRYPDAPAYAQTMILDICAHSPGRLKVYDLLIDGLLKNAENRGLYAGLLAEVGNPRAIEPLKQAEGLYDIHYLDYLEVRNAIEELGGEPEPLRDFSGDPDYEALRNMNNA